MNEAKQAPAKPVHRMKRDDRRAYVDQFVGRRVLVRHSYLRSEKDAQAVEGLLVSVAVTNLSGGSDVAVLRRLGKWDYALTLASVVSIDLA